MKRIAIFASGSGSNAQRLMEHYKKSEEVEIALILTNNPDAYVLQRADNFEVPTHIFSKEELEDPEKVLRLLLTMKVDFIVLAGFLLLIPAFIIEHFPQRIINIHPALLPKYGGKGFFGKKVHEAVLKNKEKESGITIHYVNEKYDEGNIILQVTCEIEKNETADMLSYKIHQLEYQYLPKALDDLLKKLK